MKTKLIPLVFFSFCLRSMFFSVRWYFLFSSVLMIFILTVCNPKKDRSENLPMVLLKEERVREIRNLAKQDELLQEIIDEIFRMADAELDQPSINYEDLIGRPHRTTKEALSGKYVLDIASLSGSRLLLLGTAYRLKEDSD